MQAANNVPNQDWVATARPLFPVEPIPARDELTEDCRACCIELDAILANRGWPDIANSPQFSMGDTGADLATIFSHLSRRGLLYFLPGFLIHFLAVGNYQNSLSGPDFYFAFIRRIQCDSSPVSSMGGCPGYFALSLDQRLWCGDIMWNIYLRHGDPYEKFTKLGYEYTYLAQCSLVRAMEQYWKAE